MWRITLARKIRVCEALPGNLAHCQSEAVRGSLFAVVITKGLLVKIARKMERLDGDVGAFQCPLKQAPEIFDALSVYTTIHVLLRMVHHVMHEAVMQFVVAGPRCQNRP